MDRERVFAVLFGAYAGCLLAPAASFVAPAQTLPIAVAVFVVAAVAGYVVALRLEVAAALTGVWRNLSVVVFPFVYLPRVAFRPPGLSVVEFFVTPAFTGLSAALFGFFAVLTAHNFRTHRTLSETTVHAEFTAKPAPSARKWQLVGGAAVLLSGVGAAVLFALDGGGSPGVAIGSIATAMGSLSTLLATGDDEREVAVTDAGLKVQMQVHDWDTFADYEVTDDALVFERPKRRHATFKFDRESVENLSAVEEALKRYLPRE